MKENDIIEAFFNQRAKKYKKLCKVLDWGSERVQLIRFRVLMEIGNLNNCSILDIGCGFAEFFDFLQNSGIKIKRYTGIEISENIFNLTRLKKPSLDIRKMDFLTEKIDSYDYVFGSGIHYLKVGNNYKRLKAVLKKMYEICKIGVATNMLDASIKKEFANHVFPYNPEVVLRLAKEISPYTILRNDYFYHDFTIYLFKQDWATRNNYKES